MSTIFVRSKTHDYPVLVDAGLLSEFGSLLRQQKVEEGAVVAILTDATVAKLGYAQTVQQACMDAGYLAHILTVPAGDHAKRLDVVAQLYYQLLDLNVRRNGVIVAVGGGVVGDLAGFVAATYQRGIRFFQVPTTLLAHDSSIGGKVGVNLTLGKNLVGAFYPPVAVVYDVCTLSSLPAREWRNGMAEVIKHGLIGDRALFGRLQENPMAVCPDVTRVIDILTQAMAVKIRIIEADEREAGQRMALNIGHSVGHAVEQLSNYSLGHGEAIAIGLCVEANVAYGRGLLSKQQVHIVSQVLHAHGLPTMPTNDTFASIAARIDVDKKNTASAWTFALLQDVGQVVLVHDIRPEEVRLAWEETRLDALNQNGGGELA